MKSRKVKMIFIAVLALTLSACITTDNDVKVAKEAQTNYNACQAKYYTASELVKVELTTDGKVKSMAVGNQNLQACQMAQAPKSAAVAMVEVVGSVANNALNVAASSVPYVAMAKIASDGIKNSGSNTYNDGSFNSHSEANQANQQTSETVNGIKAGGDVDQSQQNQNNPTSTTNTDDNSTKDSNNGGNDSSSTQSTDAESSDDDLADDIGQ
jgi:hypothetical protein